MRRPEGAVAVGIDVGGTRLKGARVRLAGDAVVVEARAVRDVRPEARGREASARAIAELARELVDGAATVGLAVAGAVARPSGRVSQAANYPDWRDFDVAGEVGRLIGLEVRADNDANLFTLAECRFGAGRGREDVLGVTLGTGVGGGLVLGGRLRQGRLGLAGELGHLVLRQGGEPCGCGARGCVEQYASIRFLEREAPRRLRGPGREVSRAALGRELAAAADAGDEAARTLFHELGANLGEVLGGVLNLLDVEAVVIGGGLAQAFSHIEGGLVEAAGARMFADARGRVPFLPAELGDDAGAIGAALWSLG